jgi:hypothetical protein
MIRIISLEKIKDDQKVDEMVSSSLMRHQSAIIGFVNSINRKGDQA